LTGHKVEGVRVCLTDGQAHAVDSSELAFKLAAKYAFTQGFNAAKPQVLEPVMGVEVQAPQEFQGTVISLLNKRRAQLQGSDADDMYVTIQADVPLSMMFGFSTDLRSGTQGKGEFTMEYKEHQPVLPDQQAKLAKAYQEERRGGGGN
jgi:elongation factor G